MFRVTSLADALKLNFALITTDRRRANYDTLSSKFHSTRHSPAGSINGDHEHREELELSELDHLHHHGLSEEEGIDIPGHIDDVNYATSSLSAPSIDLIPDQIPQLGELRIDTAGSAAGSSYHLPPHPEDDFDEEYSDDNARDVTYGRLVQGHVVDDDYPSAPPSTKDDEDDTPAHMINSIYSIASSGDHALGGAIDNETDEEEEADIMSAQERTITLVGHVRGRTVLIVDDMIDRPGSWIAAAEHCVKRAGAKKVYCIATHGVFGGECLEEMEACDYIDYVSIQIWGFGAFSGKGLIRTALDHCHKLVSNSCEKDQQQQKAKDSGYICVALRSY